MTTEPPMVDAALGYADLGWPVIPVEPRGKRPLIKRWPEWGNSNADVLIAAWHKYPDANIGLVTGVAFDVLDIDGPKGRETLERLLVGRYTHEGPAVRTGRGLHLYFAPTGEGNRTDPRYAREGPPHEVTPTLGPFPRGPGGVRDRPNPSITSLHVFTRFT